MKKTFAGLVAALAVVVPGWAPNARASDKDAEVQVRVVTHSGQIVADRTLRTGTTRVPTSARATCFGGTPTNDLVRVAGSTALGALVDAARTAPGLRPILVTNAFDFGLGVCSIGEIVPEGEEYWMLKLNGAVTQTGGDKTFLETGDHILWYLTDSWTQPPKDELGLTSSARPGSRGLVRVLVRAFAADGSSRPVAGATVFAGGERVGSTDAAGRLGFVPPRGEAGSIRLVARLAGHIPSNRTVVSLGR